MNWRSCVAENRTIVGASALSWDQRAWRWRVLAATYFAYVGYYLTRKVFTIAKTSIAATFSWDLQDVAHIWTTYLVSYMLGQFICSFIGRKWGPRILLLGGLGLSMLCNIIFGFANSYATFLTFMAFNGLVQASGWPGSVGGVAHWLRRGERGFIMGVWSSSYLIGNILVKSLGGLMLGHLGWRWSFWGCTLISFAFWWLIWFWQRTTPADAGIAPIADSDKEEGDAVQGLQKERISVAEFFRIALNPVILAMGAAYFCIKFLRYALDSWLPTFLTLQGFKVDRAAFYSQIFDIAGLAGLVVSGWAMDRLFRGRWDRICCFMGVGMILGYVAVMWYGANPYTLAFCYGLVGFMLYGPDTLLGGAAAVEVAGNVNGIAVAGIVNGLGSIGPIFQEEIIGWLMGGEGAAATQQGIRNVSLLTLGVSMTFVLCMAVLTLRLNRVHRAAARARRAEAATAATTP
jgi:MFS transporter, OPA family, glycerol-3-phosphate transporter